MMSITDFEAANPAGPPTYHDCDSLGTAVVLHAADPAIGIDIERTASLAEAVANLWWFATGHSDQPRYFTCGPWSLTQADPASYTDMDEGNEDPIVHVIYGGRHCATVVMNGIGG